jgi:hypothetical protein
METEGKASEGVAVFAEDALINSEEDPRAEATEELGEKNSYNLDKSQYTNSLLTVFEKYD